MSFVIEFKCYFNLIYYKSTFKSSTCKDPNIWKFIEIIKENELKQNLKKVRLDGSFLRERGRNKDDILRDLQIEKFKNCLIKKEITLIEFLLNLGEKVVKNYKCK